MDSGAPVGRLVIDIFDLEDARHSRKFILWELMNAGAPIEDHLSPRVINALQSPLHLFDIPLDWLPEEIPGWRCLEGCGTIVYEWLIAGSDQ